MPKLLEACLIWQLSLSFGYQYNEMQSSVLLRLILDAAWGMLDKKSQAALHFFSAGYKRMKLEFPRLASILRLLDGDQRQLASG